MLYAYGAVQPGQAAPGITGIDGAAVEVLPAGGVGVAVSRLAAEVQPTRDRLVQHHRVTLALARAGGVAPFRFGNMFPGEAELRRGLHSRESELERKVQALAGCVEMAVRIRPDAAGRPSSGKEYLLRKKRQLAAADRLRAGLGDRLKDWRQEARRDGLEAACLVRQADAAGFPALVTGIEPAAEVSGPWPPSSFV